MKDFIEYIFKQIVTQPEEVQVREEREGDAYVYYVKTAQEDMGIVIGKEGRNIKSLRNVAKAKAIKENIYVKLILEEDRPREQEPEEEL